MHRTNLRQRFDQGPSLLLLPHLFAEAFYDLDTSLEDEGVNLVKCEPNYNIWFNDGERFQLSTDVARMKTEVEKWEGKDGFERYLGYLQEAHRHYEISVTHVLRRNFTSILSMARPSFLKHLLELHPFESIYTRAAQYFKTERLRRVFTFGSMYMGMSPFDAPGTYSLLQYTELAEGIWYPIGGFQRVLAALENVGRNSGVTYRLSTSVKNVNISSGRAVGITLEDGEKLDADVVVVNADLVYSYNNLLPPSRKATYLSTKPGSCSSISFYWAMDKVIPELSTHNVFLADKYQESFDNIFKLQSIPDEPSFYVNVPSRIDPSAAPEGKDSIVVLVPVGHLMNESEGRGLQASKRQDWDAMIEKARQAVLDTVESRTGAKLRHHIINEMVNTPATWKEKFNLDKGAILGLSHSFFNVLSFRPSTRHSDYQGLYFVGASTHPGTGVPICLAGSKVTSEQILDDYGLEYPWPRGRGQGVKNVSLDTARRPPVTFGMALLTLLSSAVLYLVLHQVIRSRWLDV